MTGKGILFKLFIIVIVLLSVPVFGTAEQANHSMPERSYKNKVLHTANTLIHQRKADEAISAVKKYQGTVREDFDSKILLAEAYLEKCSQWKETSAVPGSEYTRAIFIPFNMGKQIIINYQYDRNKLSYGNYICAKSFLLNDRPQRAERYCEYAMEQCESPDVNFYILKADISAENYYRESTTAEAIADAFIVATGHSPDLPSQSNTGTEYTDIMNSYESIIASTGNKLIKGRIYYKMGVFGFNCMRKGSKPISEYANEHVNTIQEYFKTAIKTADGRTISMSYYYLGIIQKELGNKDAADTSFASALSYATGSSLKSMIQKKID